MKNNGIKVNSMLLTQVEYCLEANRKATFKKWVFSDKAKCSAAKLAEAGFIFTGSQREQDSVKCFFCNKSLDCWDEDDDPWAEHKKHAPYCSFAQKDKPERAFTLLEFVEMRNEFIANFLDNAIVEQLDKDDEMFDELLEMVNALK